MAHGKFLVRVKYWIVLPANSVHLPSLAITGANVCQHIYGLRLVKGSLREMLNCRMNYGREQDYECLECSSLRQCPRCEAEYQVDVRELGPRGLTIVIT